MKNQTSNVSVLLPTYNVEKYISKTLDSIIQQTYKNINILIIDDCSTDDTFNIIKKYKEKDSRIQIFRNSKNEGIVKTRNKLFDLSNSEYQAIFDADDLYDRNRLQVQVNFLTKNKDIDAVSSHFIHGIGSTSICRFPLETNLINAYFHLKNVFPNPGAMIRKTSLRQINIKYREDFQYASDFDFWSRLSEFGKLANVDECLFSYRIHNQQISEKKKLQQKNSHLQIVRNRLNENCVDCSDMTLRALIWKDKVQKVTHFQSIFLETNGIIEKLKKKSLNKDLVTFVFDVSLKSFCKDYGILGLLNYIKYRGINNFIKSRYFGLNFAFDCIKNNFQNNKNKNK